MKLHDITLYNFHINISPQPVNIQTSGWDLSKEYIGRRASGCDLSKEYIGRKPLELKKTNNTDNKGYKRIIKII